VIAPIAARTSEFVPGQWTKLDKDQIRKEYEDKIREKYAHNELFMNMLIKQPDKATKALMEKGVVYRNGNIEAQFYLGGATIPEKTKQEIIDYIEKLQLTNGKEKLTVIIGNSKKGAYGWAVTGGNQIWIAPSTVRMKMPNPMEWKDGHKMPVLQNLKQWEYTLAHEWGHHIDINNLLAEKRAARSLALTRLKTEFPDAFVSKYAKTNEKEFYAEMFAEWFGTSGTTNNALVQAMAKEFGWKVPKVKAKVPEVKAKVEMPYPWKPTLKYTKPEEFLNPDNYKFYAKELKEAATAPLAMRIDRNSLQKVIKDGRFKSLSEVDTNFGGSREIVEGYRQNRIRLENGTWGIPKDVQQPLYGYMDRQITIPRTTGNTLQDPSVSFYGEIQIILKDDVKNRTTITLGDSLNTNRTPVEINQALEGNLSNAQVSSAVDIGAYDYYEAQIHGGLSITDIKEIKLNGKTLSAADKQALLEKGIIISE
jgi:hypothetical protein